MTFVHGLITRRQLTMKPDAYKVINMAVEEGVRLGLNRAEGAGEIPENTSRLEERITDAVMLCISEYFIFDDQNVFD